MWMGFGYAVVATLTVLFVPGFFLCRALGFSRMAALVGAPVVAVGCIAGVAILYYRLEIPCNPISVLAPYCVFCIAAWAIRRPWRFEHASLRGAHVANSNGFIADDLPLLFLYVAVGVATTAVLFVFNLHSADTPFCRLDNVTHLNAIRAFIDSGIWSSTVESPYLGAPMEQTPYDFVHGGFYPSAFHNLVACVCSMTGTGVTVGVNAVVAVLAGVMLPSSMLLFMKALFPTDRLIVGLGSIATMAFAAFPWGFLTHGPLYANILGNILMMIVSAVVVLLVEGRLGRRVLRVPTVVVYGALAFVALVLAHPSTVFALFVFLVAFAGHTAVRAIENAEHLSSVRTRLLKVLAVIGIALMAAACWAAFLHLPFVQSLLHYSGGNNKSLVRALVHLLSGYLAVFGSQLVVAAVLCVGVVYCIRKRWWWMLVPVAFFAAAFVVARMSSSELQHILAGFWYNKPFRVAGCYVLFVIPVLSVGLAWLVRLVSRGKGISSSAVVCVLAFFLVGNCVPFALMLPGSAWKIDSGFKDGLSMVWPEMHYYYSDDREQIYSADEIDFVNRAAAITGGDLVLNQPNDGSAWAYGVNHLNTYFRYIRVNNVNNVADIVRLHLSEYTKNSEVQQAVASTGARYVLQLDQGVAYEDGVWLVQYHKDDMSRWGGIDAIRDTTPGFTVVLSEGDMRLYEIDPSIAENGDDGDNNNLATPQ